MDRAKVERLVLELLGEIGEDPSREGLLRTPRRVAEVLELFTSGYRADLRSVINGAVFAHDADQMIVVRDIEVASLCEHHMLPFVGRCHIGYVPHGRIFGLSKLARVVDLFARRLQIQERLTDEIARAVMDGVGARGVGVIIEARHMCTSMRGIRQKASLMVTSTVLGSFRTSAPTRAEFVSLVRPAGTGMQAETF